MWLDRAFTPRMSREHVVGVAITLFLLACHVLVYCCAGGLWRDETNSVQLATQFSLSELWRELEHDSFPLPWFLFLRGWHALGLGTSDHGWRLIGLIAGVTMVGMLWVAGRTLSLDQQWRLPLIAAVWIALCPATLHVGDSVRGYGTGMILQMGAIICTWRYLATRSLWHWLAMAVVFLASVQVLFYNALAVFALGVAAATIGFRRRSFAAVIMPLLAGGIRAASFLPYRDMFARMSAWNFLVKTQLTPPVFLTSWNAALHDFSLGLSPDPRFRVDLLPHFAPLCLHVAGLALALLVCYLDAWRHPRPMHGNNPQRDTLAAAPSTGHPSAIADRAWFCGVSLGIYVPLYLITLSQLGYVLHPRYFLGLIAFTGILVDMALDTRIASFPRGRSYRLAVAGILALLSASSVVRASLLRQTNVDLAARYLEEHAGGKDLILVSPWYVGVSFDYHFTGRCRWMTMPAIERLEIHRYDDYLVKARDPNHARDITAAIEAASLSGGDVWYVGTELVVAPGAAGQTMLQGSGYGLGVANLLLQQRWAADMPPPLTAQPVQEFENVSLLRFRRPAP